MHSAATEEDQKSKCLKHGFSGISQMPLLGARSIQGSENQEIVLSQEKVPSRRPKDSVYRD
jgi:hypothetical protein